jgi:hypothetical protein
MDEIEKLHVSRQFVNLIKAIISVLKKPLIMRKDADVKRVKPLIKEIKFFKERNLSELQLNFICKKLTYLSCKENDVLFNYGNKFS